MSIEVTSSPKTQPDSRGRRLESWKEIAAYLGRDVTTVRRWEKREGLPVYRLQHSKLGSVYAYTLELDAWREKEADRETLAGATDAPEGQADHPTARIRPVRRWLIAGGVAVVALLVAAYFALGRKRDSDARLAQLLKTPAEDESFWIAIAYALRNENDLAFEWLDKAYASRELSLSTGRTDYFAPLHDDPR